MMGIVLGLAFFGLGALVLGLEWWGLFRHWVYGSPTVCYWTESIVCRIFGCNRWPIESEVLYLDTLYHEN
jgi:hypothetical protein